MKHNHAAINRRGLRHHLAARILDFCFHGNFIHNNEEIKEHCLEKYEKKEILQVSFIP
jgi:hypothetical protein